MGQDGSGKQLRLRPSLLSLLLLEILLQIEMALNEVHWQESFYHPDHTQ